MQGEPLKDANVSKALERRNDPRTTTPEPPHLAGAGSSLPHLGSVSSSTSSFREPDRRHSARVATVSHFY